MSERERESENQPMIDSKAWKKLLDRRERNIPHEAEFSYIQYRREKFKLW